MRANRLWALAVTLLFVVSCQTDEYPAPVGGSTYRITKDVWDEQSEIYVDILTTDLECANAKVDDLEACRPKVDRANAEVHLSMVFRDRTSTQTSPYSLTADQVDVLHQGTRQSNYELIPHNPRSSGQLYIVVIDGSSSMSIEEKGGTRIQKVRRALLSTQVLNAFFPPNETGSGVLLMQFTDELRPLDGGEVKVIRGRKEYQRQVREYLQTPPGGFTYLYKAIRLSMTKLLTSPDIKEYLGTRAAQATVIVLTDGFNNEQGSDTCGDNVRRLQQTLDVVRKARASGALAKPTMYTVGLGTPYSNAEKPEGLAARVTAGTLCGKYADQRIDGLLEDQGIDQVSLAWLAESGGGKSYVKRKSRDLANIFVQAAAKRYEWFEIRYRVVDPIWHRSSFDTRIQLRQGYRAGSTVSFMPNPWIDAPTAKVGRGERWMKLTPLRHTFSLLMPILGAFVFLSFVGAAFFNATRAVFRRARPRK